MLARWEFAIVTIFHFFFVPLTIGLGFLVALSQTIAYRRHDKGFEQLTGFFGRLFLINLAVGVVTGIVLEFQFGLNWSAYSVFVGNIFGAPLAIEGLLAFFLESTFIGLWVFGKDRLSPRLHLATIWATSLGTILSAFFILAANAWMQHPVGFRIEHHQAVLTNFWAVLGNSTLWESFAHTVLAAFATGGALVLGISVWRSHRDRGDLEASQTFSRAARLSGAFSLVSVVLTAIAGDAQARLMDSQQPMKMAAAEALYNTQRGASFSLLTIGNLKDTPIFQIRLPHLLSLIATLSWNGKVLGVNQIQAAQVAAHGKGSYVPVIWLTYWSFRIMAGAGIAMILLGALALYLARRDRLAQHRWFRAAALAGIALPMVANATGWIFTEVGRQPWVVYGVLTTPRGVSAVGAPDVAASLFGFIAIYAVLGALDALLMVRAARRPLEGGADGPGEGADAVVPGLIY